MTCNWWKWFVLSSSTNLLYLSLMRLFLTIHKYQEAQNWELCDELWTIPVGFHNLPFHEHIYKNTPVAAINASTEQLLWHQWLGHPSDFYLYNINKHVKAVPKFKMWILYLKCALDVSWQSTLRKLWNQIQQKLSGLIHWFFILWYHFQGQIASRRLC